MKCGFRFRGVLSPYPRHFPEPPALPLMSMKEVGQVVKPRACSVAEKSPHSKPGGIVSEQLTLRLEAAGNQQGQLFTSHSLHSVCVCVCLYTHVCAHTVYTLAFRVKPPHCTNLKSVHMCGAISQSSADAKLLLLCLFC